MAKENRAKGHKVKDRMSGYQSFKTSVRGPGIVYWEGNSLIDGAPIAVICNGFKMASRNRKTGPMIQVYILRQDVDPWTALVEGKDESICGDCIHRPQMSGGGGRSCYVQVYPWVTTVWKAYKRGSYTHVSDLFGMNPFRARDVRVGAYGDPAAVPTHVWESMLEHARGYTMYTHLWRQCDPALKRWAMASVDTPEEYRLAMEAGWRTFRTRFATEPLTKYELVCPASEEAEKKTRCIDCQLCDGRKEEDKRKNIAIVAHGAGGGWYVAARSELNARSQGLLPILP